MVRSVDVNGRYCRGSEAMVSFEDRGYQFADGVYEVCAVLNGRCVDLEPHLVRLDRSLAELRIPKPMSDAALKLRLKEVLRRNRVREGTVYIQVNRGVAPRDHAFPANTKPSVIITAKRFDFSTRLRQAERGIPVITVPETRWARPDIKSVSLLPNCMAKQAAKEAGAMEAWFVRPDGTVTEGSSTNAWIVTQGGVIVTHPEGTAILGGVMRGTLLRLAREHQMQVEERPFTIDEARQAAEAFITSTTMACMPVVNLDGTPVGTGQPGPVARRLVALMWEEISRQTGYPLPRAA